VDAGTPSAAAIGGVKIETKGLNLHYGGFHALIDVNIRIRPSTITAIIGPSGCGKSTLLRCFNRLNELIPTVKTGGQITLDGESIYEKALPLTELRKRVGMVFQRPNPFPLSIYDNIAYGPRVHGVRAKGRLDAIVESSLRATLLWEDLKDRLGKHALALSPEQQQRLCISRLAAIEPEVLLMDEPCSTLDPVATQHIEELMRELSSRYTIVIVTHNMQQATRVSTEIGFMLLGELVEFGETEVIFTRPSDKRTEEYVTGRYG
jgi:phosphate transport system ATP-binding protein